MSAVSRGIFHTGFAEPCGSQTAAVALPTCPAIVVRLITGHRHCVINTQPDTRLHDLCLAKILQGCPDGETLPLYTCLGRQVRHALERLNEFRTTIRIA